MALRLTVSIEVVLDLAYLIAAHVMGRHVAYPGGVVRLVAMSGLGWLAISKHASWARWVFAAIEYFTAALSLFFAFYSLERSGVQFSATGLGLFIVYLSLALGATLGRATVATELARPVSAAKSS